MKCEVIAKGYWVSFMVLTGLSASVQAGATPLTSVRVAFGLDEPLFVTFAPADFDRIFIVEQAGKIKILRGGVVLATPFLDITELVQSGGEQGFLGLAFHPDYAKNGHFYVHYTNLDGLGTIARYQVSTANPDVADPKSAALLLVIEPESTNHNGGWIAFGPNDGHLYIARGEGGMGSDAQNGNSLRGKVLRIDVDGAFPYAIPPDNPFVNDETVLDEIWAMGLRNPWRASFDRLTGDLWIGDVGYDSREEIDYQSAKSAGGENYGWPCMEGSQCSGGGSCECTPELILPIFEYAHSGGSCAVTGGYVYRGCAISDLAGAYFFADYCSDRIYSFRYVAEKVTELTERTEELTPPPGSSMASISSFGEDAYGELYLCDLNGGEVFKIVPDTAGPEHDCDANGLEDVCEILDGSAGDSDDDGLPDQCERRFCEGDANVDGAVDPLDAGFVQARFGCTVGAGNPDCDAADQNGDGTVDPLDSGFVLSRFGDCS